MFVLGPREDFIARMFFHVGATHSTARHEDDVFTRFESTLVQVGRSFLFDFLVSGGIPVDSRIVHLVDQHN